MWSDKNLLKPNDIFIGGAGDHKTRLVEHYQLEFKQQNKDRAVFYFRHTQFRKALSVVNALPADHQINLIGHSYGAATASAIARETDRVINILIGVDSVKKLFFCPDLRTQKSVHQIVHVTATGTENRIYDGNFIAGVGRVFGGGIPAIFKTGMTVQINAPFAHYNFKALMNYENSQAMSASQVLRQSFHEFQA